MGTDGRIAKAFGSPILEHFVKEQKIDVTADEIHAFKKQSQKRDEDSSAKKRPNLPKLQAKLLAGDLSDKAKAKLEQQKTQIEGASLKSARSA